LAPLQQYSDRAKNDDTVSRTVRGKGLTIQYWLIDFGTTCPTNFQAFPITDNLGVVHHDCVQLVNSMGAVPTTAVPVTNLSQVTLTGAASTGADSVTVTS
jgi:hypothetical protein